ncbi:BBP7 family outer membrane beta-barrel protein, partial [Planctomycetota bacterium]
VSLRDQVYGYGFTGQDHTIGGVAVTAAGTPIIDGDGLEFLDGLDDGLLPDSQTQLANPFGSVMILFDYEPGLMSGFIDLAEAPGTGAVGVDDTNGDGFLDGDGIADDINLNGVSGADTVDAATGIRLIDFGDLVELPTSFHLVNVRSILKNSSIQLMRSRTLQAPRNGRTGVEMLYGVRYTNFDDHFYVRGEGGVLGRSFWNTEINNRLMGPQVGCRWTRSHGRWGLSADARALMAVNVQNWEQDASIGEDLVPSSNNHPLYFSPTVSHHGKRQYEFAPMGELKLNSNYQLTKGVTLNLGYNGMFAYGVRRSATHVHYRLPNMGFVEGKRETIIMSGLNMGLTFSH